MMMDILSTEDYELCGKLKAMRFSGMAEALEELLRDPNSDLIPFREKVGRLVDAEWDLRYNKKLNRFMKKATLKYPHADLDDTIYDPERLLDARIIEELAKCKWVDGGGTESDGHRAYRLRQKLSGQRPGHLCPAAVQDRKILQGQPAH